MDLSFVHYLPKAEQDEIQARPALSPPPGISEPNFENPPNGDALAYAVVTICLVASSLAVLVRFYAKFIRTRKLFLEDYLMVAAFGLFVGYIYVTYWALDIIGFFVHQWDIRLRDFWTLLYIVHLNSNLYAVTMLIMKASILREWSRIFVPYGTRNMFWWTCHVVIVITVLFYGISFFLENLACFPYERIWNKTIPGSKCLDFKAIPVAGAAINVFLDLVTFILPQKTIWSLHMSRKKKIGVSSVFAIGILACSSAIARLVYTVFYFLSDDIAYSVSPLSLWLIAEMTCMLLIFAGPAVPQAFAGAQWIAKVKTTLRSWTGLSSERPSNAARYGQPGQVSFFSRPRKVYRKWDALDLDTITLATRGDSVQGLTADAQG